MVVYNDSFYSVTLFDQAGHFAVYQYFGSMKLGVNDVCRSKTERVYRSVRDLYCADDVRICRRLYAKRFLRVDYIGSDTCRKA